MTQQRQAHHRTHLTSQLTSRQREVLARVADGKTNHEIAIELGITLDGVKWHVSEILARMGVSTREAAAEAWRRDESKLSRLRRSIGLAPLAAKPMAVVAGGASAFMVVVTVLFVAMAARGDGLSPSDVEATQTAEANALRPAPCEGDDSWVASFRGFWPSGPGIGGFGVVAEQPCRLLGDLTVTILDDAGKPLKMPGNPSSVFVDMDLPLRGMVIPGVRVSWGNWCAYQGSWFTIRLTAGGTSLDERSHPSLSPNPVGERCDPATPMSLTIEEAAWDRHSYLSSLLPAGTLGLNPVFSGKIPIESVCGREAWVCEALGYVDHWLTNAPSWSRPAPHGSSLFVFCGEEPEGFSERNEAPRIVPMDHPACVGKPLREQISGYVGLEIAPDGSTIDVYGEYEPGSTYLKYGKPDRVVSLGCVAGVAECQDFVIALAFDESPTLVYIAYRASPTNVDKAPIVGWGRSNAPEMRTGGVALTVLGDAEFFPLP